MSREFLNSGLAAVGAIVFTNPLDVVRTRLQLQGQLQSKVSRSGVVYRGIGHALYKIGTQEGIRGLQRGLNAACLLQFSNVSMRFGAYNVSKQVFQIGSDASQSYSKSLVAAGFSGAMAALVSNPFFLVKNRLQDTKYQYKSLYDALHSIYTLEGGLLGFYKGLSAFIPRVIAASAVQLTTYDVVKQSLIEKAQCCPNAISTHFYASLITGVAVVGAMQPFDFAATRTMSQPLSLSNGRRGTLYSGPVDVLIKTVRTEGVRGVYKGALASYLRFGPYCVLVFVFLEQLRLFKL